MTETKERPPYLSTPYKVLIIDPDHINAGKVIDVTSQTRDSLVALKIDDNKKEIPAQFFDVTELPESKIKEMADAVRAVASKQTLASQIAEMATGSQKTISAPVRNEPQNKRNEPKQ